MAGYKWWHEPADVWFVESRTVPAHMPTLEEAPLEKSGLLDKDGNPLVRQKQPMGFDLSRKPRS